MQSNHDCEVVVEQLDGSLSTNSSVIVVKLLTPEKNGTNALLASHYVGVIPVRSHCLRQFRIHVTT